MGVLFFFGVHDAVATSGQYLAVSKAGWSCYYYIRWRKEVVFVLSLSVSLPAKLLKKGINRC